MKTFLLLALAVLLLPCEAFSQDSAPQLSLALQPGRRLLIRWQAQSGGTQLVWTDSLGNPTAWQPLAGVQPMGGAVWQAEFNAAFPRAFFTLHPASLPVAPPNVRLIPVGDHFQLEWDSTSDAAGYVVYIGLTPAVGPGNAVRVLNVPLANAVEILGLDPGKTYYVAITATNAQGEGSPSQVLSGVFGPKGVLGGTAVQSFPLGSGETFEVLAEGATINVASLGNAGAPPLRVVTDADGHFRFPNLPVGEYVVGYVFGGQAGFLPGPVVVSETGAAISPLVIPSGPQRPPPGSTLLGTLTLSDGSPARCDIEEFDLHVRSTLRALLGSGDARVVVPDRNGAWALTDLTPSDFPISLVMDYGGLPQRTVTISAAPLELTRIALVFPEILPSVKDVRVFQNGHEVETIARGVPVTVVGEIENPDGLPVEPRWIAEFNGQRQLATGPSATFLFNQPPAPPGPGLGDPRDSGLVLVQLLPTGIKNVGPPKGWQLDIAGVGCWAGVVAEWSPYGPNVVVGTEPATVIVKHAGPLSPSTASTIMGRGGYFEMPVDPTGVPPYLVRAEKPGYMRFLWPFEQRLPDEATYCVTAAQTLYATQHPSGPQTLTHPLGGSITIPWGAVTDPLNQAWFGDLVVTMAVFDPFVHHPLPPGAEVRGPGLRNGVHSYGGVWFDITNEFGVPLTPTSACTLTLPVPSFVTVSTMPGYHQVESTGYFERWGFGGGPNSVQTASGKYTISLGTKGLFLVGFDNTLVELFIEPDRTLGYPFDVQVYKSVFPITVQGFHKLNIGKLFVPRSWGAQLRVIDPRVAPGQHYPNLNNPLSFSSPMQKSAVVVKGFSANVPPLTLPAIPTSVAAISLADQEPALNSVSPSIAALNSPTHFLSRGIVSSATDAQDYYARINAPATLAQWRTLNGFPVRFGAPLSISADDYATAYYYNLGDLGFARAQTMRIKISSLDGGYDTAFQVTNYRSIDDAICGRGAIATVCMDSSARYDTGAQSPSRYTRFYVYGSNDALLQQADLDGAGLKGVPNLCIQCHGGKMYDTTDVNRTPNVGARFLPFDLEAFTYHPKFGVQKPEFARMNKGVLLTGPSAATFDLITGWYGTSNPLTALNTFNANYFPASWSGQTGLYLNVFKTACRGCHNTRETTNYAQFSSYTALQSFGFGNFPAGKSLQMPHAQRTWSIFWGSRCSVLLGEPVANMPTILGTAAGTIHR